MDQKQVKEILGEQLELLAEVSKKNRQAGRIAGIVGGNV